MSTQIGERINQISNGVLAWVYGRWQQIWPAPKLAPVVKVPSLRPRKAQIETETVLWEFKSGILDRLDEYFHCMKQMRRFDGDAYKLYSRVGLSIPAHRFSKQISFTQGNLPTFGGMLFGTSGESLEKYPFLPSLIYFTKVKHPSAVQWHKGAVYHVVVIYDDRKWENRRFSIALPVEFHVGVNPDGSLRLLKHSIADTRQVEFRHRNGHRSWKKIRLQRWEYPWLLGMVTLDSSFDKQEEFAFHMFGLAFATARDCRQKVVVRAKKDNVVAAFGIDVKLAKSFFKDRSATALARDGKRKRIFHSVVAHERELATGKVVSVKYHYRGLRHFDWLGHNIAITAPKNNFLLDCPVDAEYAEDVTNEASYIGSVVIGRKLDRALSA